MAIPKGKKIWMDGTMVDWEAAQVHVLTHTLHYGLGVFEGIRAYELDDGSTAIIRLQDHIDRLYQSAHIMTIKIPFKKEELFEACKEILRANGLKHGYIRPIVFLGDGEMGLYATTNKTRVSIIAWPWGTYLGDEGVKKGIRTKISSYTRHHVNAALTKAKSCSNYVNSILAKREAIAAGYEEAIFLNAQGYVTEASGENIFVVSQAEVRTTPLNLSVLKGITRDIVMTILRDQGITCKEEAFTRDDLYIADEIFLTGTAAEVTPIREVDDRMIGAGEPGPITKKIQTIFSEIISGKQAKYDHWLDRV
jgi:branched-chain amino acid aminotransferase